MVRSDLADHYDKPALELAQNLQIVDYTRAVLVHFLVYQIADGTMAM